MSISAIIPVAHLASANATLEALGHGPCFTVPLRTGTADATHAGLHAWTDPVLLASLQSIPNVIISTDGEGSDLFAAHTASQALEWSDPTLWHLNPVMIGDIRLFDGIEHRSLIDYNVWTPHAYPRGWELVNDPVPDTEWKPNTLYVTGDVRGHLGLQYRCRQGHTSQLGWEPPIVPALWELVVAAPEPEPEPTIPNWQPWNGQNASLYQIGDEVMHNGIHWRATVGNNHWEPGVFGWVQI